MRFSRQRILAEGMLCLYSKNKGEDALRNLQDIANFDVVNVDDAV